jgi:hypothetical protein
MQTEEEETPQVYLSLISPKQANTWASLHQVSEDRGRWIIFLHLKGKFLTQLHTVPHTHGHSTSDVSFCQAKREEGIVNA